MVVGPGHLAQRRRSRRVLCLGDTLVDEVHTPSTTARFAGGAGLLLTCGLRILGVPSSLVTVLGTDSDGLWLSEVLRAHDVHVYPGYPFSESGIAISERTTESYPEYTFNDAVRNREYEFTPEVRAGIRDARITVVNTFPLDDHHQSEMLMEAMSNATGLRIVDPNPRPTLLRDILAFTANLERLTADADLVALSQNDTDLLYGIEASSLARRLLDQGTKAVLITEGTRGVTLMTRGGSVLHHPIVGLPGPIVDTMGASTAVLASIIETLYKDGIDLTDDQWMQALAKSQLIAAATCRTIGGILELPNM